MLYIAETFTSNSIDLEYVWSARTVYKTACSTDVGYDTQNPVRVPQVGHRDMLSRRMQSKGGHAIEEGTLVIVK